MEEPVSKREVEEEAELDRKEGKLAGDGKREERHKVKESLKT